MGPEGFELFARALHGAQPGIFNTSSYGTSGFKQYGADHIAYSQGAAGLEISVGQSKAYKEFEQDSHWKGKSVRRFILFVGCRIRKAKSTDEIIAQAQKLAALGVAFEVWDATEIYGRLAAAQHVVRLHLGLGWVEHLFGPAVNPIAAIVQDVARGDLGALSATMLVGQLNRAEAAQVADLRRRIRRGEVAAARRDIGQALAQPVVDALADDVRADLLRLSAALNALHGDPDKAKAELDEADQLDDRGSARQRAMLCTETLGPEKTIEGYADTTDPDVAEVVASSYLRLGRNPEALAALAPGLAIAAPSAETLRLAALAHLLSGDRDAAVDHARRSVDREAESRACRHLLALTLFARAVTPRFEVQPGDWPVPIDQPLILATDQARADLEDARGMIAALAADPELDHHREILAWSFAIHACIPTAKPSAEDMLTDLIAQDRLTGPIVAWSLARGLPLDLNLAARTIDRERDADREDAQLLLMAIAIASQRRERAAARALLDERGARLCSPRASTPMSVTGQRCSTWTRGVPPFRRRWTSGPGSHCAPP